MVGREGSVELGGFCHGWIIDRSHPTVKADRDLSGVQSNEGTKLVDALI